MYVARLRHHQFTRYNETLNTLENVINQYNAGTGDITEVLGNVPEPTYNYYNGIDGLTSVELEWEFDKENSTTSSVSGELSFVGEAYDFVYNWLIDNEAGFLNVVDIEIWDDLCNKKVGDYQISSDGIRWCEGECSLKANIKLPDEVMSCFERTLIDNDHQDWYNADTTHYHPIFTYCKTKADWEVWLNYVFLGAVISLVFVLIIIINPIVFILNAITDIINGIFGAGTLNYIDCNGDGNATPDNPCINANTIDDIFTFSFGCDRHHYAGYVRDYINNVCAKCSKDLGYTIAFNADSFNANEADYLANDPTYGTGSIFNTPTSPYYNLTYFYPNGTKGIKNSNQRHYDKKNTMPTKNLKEFLNDLKGVFNARWYVKKDTIGTGYTLYFEKKTSYLNQADLFDFTQSADYDLLLETICYEWNGEKKPSFLEFRYSDDAQDDEGNKAKRIYNDVVVYNQNGNNKAYGDGTINLVQFSPVRVYNDNIEEQPYDPDWFPQSIQVAGTILSLGGGAALWNGVENQLDGYLILGNRQTTQPKLIIFDPVRINNNPIAEAIQGQATYPLEKTGFPNPNPIINTNLTPYPQINESGEMYNSPEPDITLFNYPMMFEPNFLGNLYDYFWDIERPLNGTFKHKNFEIRLKYCCEVLDRLKIWHNEQTEILAAIKLPIQPPYSAIQNKGYITGIKLERNDNGERSILIKGRI